MKQTALPIKEVVSAWRAEGASEQSIRNFKASQMKMREALAMGKDWKGKPLAPDQTYVLDAAGRLVPVGGTK